MEIKIDTENLILLGWDEKRIKDFLFDLWCYEGEIRENNL